MSVDKKESSKKKYIAIGVLLVACVMIIGLFTFFKKEHTIEIYQTTGMEKSIEEYQKIVDTSKPVLTNKDITGYNKETMMIFLSDEKVNAYRDMDKNQVKPYFARGGSLILGTEDNVNSSYIIAFDGKVISAGTVLRPAFVSYVGSVYHIKDAAGGLRLYLYGYDDRVKADRQAEKVAIDSAFEKLGLLTDDYFDIKVTRDGLYYDTDKLWENRTEFTGDNSKISALINLLQFPEGVTYESIELHTEKEPYGVIIKLKSTGGSGLSNEQLEEKVYLYRVNSTILLSLVKNLSVVDFVIDGSEQQKYSFMLKDVFDKGFEKESDVLYFDVDVDKTAYDDKFKFYKFFEGGRGDFASDVSSDTAVLDDDDKNVDAISEAELYKLFEKLVSSPKSSSDPQDYIEENNDAYKKILSYDKKASDYFLQQLSVSTEDGLNEQLMAKICQEVIGITANVGEYATGKEWYEKYTNRKLISLPNYRYESKSDFPEKDEMKLLFDTITPNNQEEQFYIVSFMYYRADYDDKNDGSSVIKQYIYAMENKYQLYRNSDGSHTVYDLGHRYMPMAVVYSSDSERNLEFIEVKEPGLLTAKTKEEKMAAMKEFCYKENPSKFDGDLAADMMEDDGKAVKYAISQLLKQHLANYSVYKADVISAYPEYSFSIDDEPSDKFAYFDKGIKVNVGDNENRELTEAELKDINQLFEIYVSYGDRWVVRKRIYDGLNCLNPITHALSSTYDCPKNINLYDLVYYMDRDMRISDAEFEALKKVESFPFKKAKSITETVTPVGKIPYKKVDELLKMYLNTSLSEVNWVGKENLIYMDEPYNSFYSIASDFGPGRFKAESGNINGGVIKLVGKGQGREGEETLTLTLKKDGDYYYINSLTN